MRHLPTRTTLAAAALAVGVTLPLVPATATLSVEEAADPADQQYRPLLHFTPEKNWMNDPNGMVLHKGTYHLFFQHNPSGTRWGNMSWGHATSPDLLHWEEQPLAIPQTFDDQGRAVEDIFSGSVVSDPTNSSGLGTADDPPLVALYTSAYTPDHPTMAGRQAQSLAYSLDDGQTWTKYAGNPVLDRGSRNFRDPKVFWYDGPAGAYWVMVAVEAPDHKVVLYRSDDLIDWTHLSDFGPANATGGIWECPDLFPLPVDGDPDDVKWVMVVNLNPGSVAGGSGGQYFVGDFDGTTFTSESTVTDEPTPAGTVLEGFDEGGWGQWQVANEPGNWRDGPFGPAPAAGTLPGQHPVTGFRGSGLVNGFHDGDWPVGTLTSPEFTIDKDFVNFLVGGGRHPHVPGGQLGNEPPAGELLFDGFEYPDGVSMVDRGWELTGDFETARNPSTQGGDYYLGAKRVNTFEGGPRGDDNTGTLTSPAFVIDDDHLSFLIGGGKRTDGSLQAELVVEGQVVRSATGQESGALNWAGWDVSALRGSTARVRLVDRATGGWGHLTFDHVVLGPEPARVRTDETSVNLLVGGEVVRTATGANSETLDWHSWDVSDLDGKQARVQVVDNNRFGWGHVLADELRLADEPARTRLSAYEWLDWGRDYYAAVTFSGAGDDERVMLGWMNNWDYANDIPTSTWRSSMSLPREVRLVTTPEGPRLHQEVVPQIAELRRRKAASRLRDVTIEQGAATLPVSGDVVQLDAVIDIGSASAAGISVLGGATSATRIGYDARRQELVVDRTESGNVTFHPTFASIDRAPLAARDGKVSFTVYLDRASVEVFSKDGLTTITDQVFPEAGASSIGVWATGGRAELTSLTVTPLAPAMWAPVRARGNAPWRP
jgi:fructan beta-fructosidase